MKKKFGLFLVGVMILVPIEVLGHPGGLDNKGCHYCRTNCSKWGLKQDEYHCHKGNTYTNSKGEVYNKDGTKINNDSSSNNTTTDNEDKTNTETPVEKPTNDNESTQEKPSNNNDTTTENSTNIDSTEKPSNDSAKPTVNYIYGCTDKTAKNYNSKANKDDGKCEYYVLGCMDKEAKNYNSEAEKDDGSCQYYIYGCTDENASNYNAKADKDDGSCELLATTDESEKDNQADSEEESDGLSTLVGVGAIAGGAYLYKKKKKK